MTSVTVFLTILILFIFGGEVTRGFATESSNGTAAGDMEVGVDAGGQVDE